MGAVESAGRVGDEMPDVFELSNARPLGRPESSPKQTARPRRCLGWFLRHLGGLDRSSIPVLEST